LLITKNNSWKLYLGNKYDCDLSPMFKID
jgi:hypothetical protein